MRHQLISKRAFRSLFFALVAILAFGLPSFGELTYMPDCQGPGCLRTAEKTDWPAPLEKVAYTMELERFVISLPSFPKRTILDRAGSVIVFCQDGSALSFDLESKYALAEGIETPEKSRFTVADSGEFVFTKTAKDPLPADPNDLWVWNQAIFLKEQVFGPSNPVYQARKGSLTAYFWSAFQGEGSLVHVFDATRPDTYIRISARKMSFDDFKRIVGAIALRQH